MVITFMIDIGDLNTKYECWVLIYRFFCSVSFSVKLQTVMFLAQL